MQIITVCFFFSVIEKGIDFICSLAFTSFFSLPPCSPVPVHKTLYTWMSFIIMKVYTFQHNVPFYLNIYIYIYSVKFCHFYYYCSNEKCFFWLIFHTQLFLVLPLHNILRFLKHYYFFLRDSFAIKYTMQPYSSTVLCFAWCQSVAQDHLSVLYLS